MKRLLWVVAIVAVEISILLVLVKVAFWAHDHYGRERCGEAKERREEVVRESLVAFLAETGGKGTVSSGCDEDDEILGSMARITDISRSVTTRDVYLALEREGWTLGPMSQCAFRDIEGEVLIVSVVDRRSGNNSIIDLFGALAPDDAADPCSQVGM